MNQDWVNTKWAWRLFWLSLIWIAFGLSVSLAHCQVCVQEPLVQFASRQERKELQAQVEGWVQKKGFQTDCETAKWEILMQPLAGTTSSDSVYFVASVVQFGDTTLGSVHI